MTLFQYADFLDSCFLDEKRKGKYPFPIQSHLSEDAQNGKIFYE